MRLKKNYNRHNLFPLFVFPLIALLFLLLPSCKDTKDTYNPEYGYEYYPVDSGHYVAYEVDSVSYTYNGQYTRDTARYQIKELVTDTFYDNENNLCYRLEVYKRANSSLPWSIYKVWKLRQTATTLIKTEDDLKFIKLTFPPNEGSEWNGNAYLPLTGIYEVFKDWIYAYSDVHQPYSINGFSFDSTLTVSEVDEESLIEKKLRKEVYAKGVGMVYQEWEIVTKQVVGDDWITGVQNGFRIRMRVMDHN